MNRALVFVLCIVGSLCNASVAKTVRFTDQNDNPVEHVIVIPLSPTSVTQSDTGNIMNQVDMQFLPRVLVVPKGQLVVFPNSDNIRHHIYSFSDPKPFEIKLYSGEDAPPVMFDSAGVVVLGCNIHDQMLGFIYVSETEIAWKSDKNGEVSLAHDVNHFSVWHPDLSIDHLKHQQLSFKDAASDALIVEDDLTIRLDLVANSFAPASSNRVFGNRKFSNGGDE